MPEAGGLGSSVAGSSQVREEPGRPGASQQRVAGAPRDLLVRQAFNLGTQMRPPPDLLRSSWAPLRGVRGSSARRLPSLKTKAAEKRWSRDCLWETRT